MAKKPEKKKILIVDDEKIFRSAFKERLETHNFEVIEAGDGHSGYELAVSALPDAILLDLLLPKMRGYEVLKRIRSHEALRNIPVIVLSIMEGKSVHREAKAAGATQCMIKGSLSAAQIARRVRELLEARAKRKKSPL